MIEMCDKHRAKLASGESVLWYGKTSPVLFYRGWTAPVVMGAFWSLIVYCYPVRGLLSKSRAPATLDMGMLLGLGACEIMDRTVGQTSVDVFGQSIRLLVNPKVGIDVAVEATVLLVVSGTLAGLIPARKAARVRPIEALRAD